VSYQPSGQIFVIIGVSLICPGTIEQTDGIIKNRIRAKNGSSKIATSRTIISARGEFLDDLRTVNSQQVGGRGNIFQAERHQKLPGPKTYNLIRREFRLGVHQDWRPGKINLDFKF